MNPLTRAALIAALVIIAPLALPSVLLLGILAALFSLPRSARLLARRLRYHVTRHRKVRVPQDGAPLTGAELRAFTDVIRGWKRPAAHPVYQERRQP